MPLEVRPETISDAAEIRRVNELAFGGPDEAGIVDRLRDSDHTIISLVIGNAGGIRGHILFSPVTAGESDAASSFMGLGPMSVHPEYQRSGLGSLLVKSGLDACRRRGQTGVVVLGHPEYYPRFGFGPASRFGLACRWPVPDEAFMALELVPGAFSNVSGMIHYSPVFG